mmetsp:Transcript_1831/g.2501  ORF Transcript_1831/g.2501 Transcript_1831/m.2501 type:complete len:191 (+) Transcript_1831:153-725(+)|eukprot:CAMPEP_0117735288 /NCGR_PEP_ID=MMETSP0947-20121206/1214_1 /TAXON_ID=44440 /ORGANISM="Chattonella subsalsa, Strain CCMP2191" /LENGTH=190 /DNA_ID=CAMNT_0005550297 /DNA_START=88 /DNA_END=663 /DNA_ORIENTATION=-
MKIAPPQRVVAAAIGVLGRSANLLSTVSADHFKKVCPIVGGSIGGHIRHSMAHYQKCLERMEQKHSGWDNYSPITYDLRERGTPEETDKDAALNLINDLRNRLEQLGTEELKKPTKAAFMLSGDGDQHVFETTLGRELAFVTHHAIHHNAMCKVIAQNMGYTDFAEELGVAPSTSNFRKQTGEKTVYDDK